MINAPTPNRGGPSRAKEQSDDLDVSDKDIQDMLAKLKA